jgi:antirestriction protein
MLAQGIGAVTSQFKKGGMTNKNTKKKLSKKEIEFIEAYANGGEVSNSELIQKDVYEIGDKIRFIDSFRKEEKEGTVYQINEVGTYIVNYGSGITAGMRGVDRKDILGAYPKVEAKKKRFGLFADGGKTIDAVWDDYRIADQYEGKKAEDIWFRLSPSQRRHLLTDHANIPNSGDLSAYVGDDVKFDDLEPFMKKILRKHFAEGQYAKGGSVKKSNSALKVGDKVSARFRYEYGEGFQVVSNMEMGNSESSSGEVVRVKDIDGTKMYYIKFNNGEELSFPDFALSNFISKSSFAKGGSVGNARTKGRESQNWEQELKEYAGENYNNLTAKEREEIISDMKKSYDKNYSYAKGGGLRKKENVYHESKYLTKEQWEKWNDYVKTGKINGKKVNNIYTVANHIGVGVSQINAYEMEQKRKDMNSKYAKGGTTDPKPSAQDILKRLGYNIPAPAEEVEEEKIIRGWVDDEPYYFAKGGMSKDDSPKVYIADLMEYNNGRLVGKWFDLTNYSDASELMEDIQAMLDEQTKKDPDGEVHEEWAVHDYENFPRAMYSEYMNEADFQKIIDVIQGAEDSNLPFDVILEAMSDLGLEDITDVKDRYFSSVPASMGNEWRDFAYEYIDGIGGISSAVKNPDYYFDFEAFGRDERINMGGEQEEEMGYEDLTDEQLGEQLVDEIGGVGELSESTIDMYFDYDKFGRELQYDFTAVRGEDGDYYFFTTNYKKGGKVKSKPKSEDDGEYELTEEDKKIIRGYVDDEPYYFAEGGEVTMDEKKKSLKGQPKLKF